MKHPVHLFLTCLCALLLVPACSGGDRQQMLGQLEELERMNQADSVMRNDSLAEQLVEYFERHGTPNERMRAHYILGRTYADMGEAPAAIAAYQDAIDKTDTHAPDCNHALLARVYAQMADVFYMQNLMQDNIENLNGSIRHASIARDTLVAINSLAYKMATFERIGQPDSVIAVCNHIYNNVYLKGEKQIASCYFGLAIGSYLQKGYIAMADTLIKAYEQYSGYFDGNHNIEEGREAFYELKGRYFIAINQLDSAEAYFRKELANGSDFFNQTMAAQGLAKLYEKLLMPDSVAKYALYSYAMNDSVYAQMATKEVEQAKGMYEYGRHQKNALAEKEKAERAYMLSYLLAAVISIVIIVAFFVNERLKLKRKATNSLLHEKARKLMQTQDELNFLREKLQKLTDAVCDKDTTIHQQKAAIESLSEIIARKEEELADSFSELANSRNGFPSHEQETDETKRKLTESKAYQILIDKDIKGDKLEAEDWESISQLVKQTFPTFYAFVTARGNGTNIKEQQLCLLFRLYVKPRRASLLIGVAPSMVTKLSKSALKKLFNANGTGKNLAERLQILG